MGVNWEDPVPAVGPVTARDPIAEPEKPGFGEVLGASFRQENSVASFFSKEDREFAPVEGYSPFDEIQGYEQYADSFVLSNSPQETSMLKRQIDRETQDRQTIQAAGWKGFVAMFAAGALDPMFLASLAVPAGGATRGARMLQQAGQGAAGASAAELALQATQETRTPLETAFNITSSTLLSGLIGGIAMPKAERANLAQAIDNDFADIPGTSTAGAAARSDTTIEQETLESAIGLEKALRGVNPLLRGIQSASRSARVSMQELAENSFFFNKNREGIANPMAVETLIKRHDGRIAGGIENTRDLFTQYRTGETGGRLTRARIAVSDAIGTTEQLNYGDFRKQVSLALRNGDQHVIPEVAQAAQWYRKNVFDPLKNDAIELGLLPKDVEVVGSKSYLTRVYRQDRIVARRGEFKNILTDWLQNSKGVEDLVEAKTLAEDITQRILGSSDGRIPYDIVPKAGPLKERVLDIQDDLIADFLEDDIEVIAERYVRTVAPEIEITRKFGDKEMTQQIQNIKDDYAKLFNSAKTQKENKALQDLMENDIRDLEAVRDLLMGTYATPKDPTAFAVQAGRRLRDLNFLRMLGGMTLSAIPDLVRPVMRHGLRQTTRSLMQAISHPQAFTMARNELRRAGIGLDMVLNGRLKAIADVQEVADLSSTLGRASQATTQAFGTATMMNPWNAAMKQFSGVMVQDSILRAARTGTRKRILAQMGIDQSMAKRIVSQFDEFGEDIGVLVSHADKWTDREASEIFQAAILRDVDAIIVTPGKADKPLMASTEMGKTIFQFKSFGFAATNKILLSGLQQRDMAALNGTLLTLALGGFVYGAKQTVAGRDITDNPADFLKESIDRSGLTGILMDVNNITEKVSRGTIGISALTGGPMMSRYQSRNITGALFGPTLDTIDDLNRVSGSAITGEWTEGDVYAARKLIPFQNLFYLRNLFNKIEDQVAEELVQ